jgi:hypothetical protein
MKSLFSFSFFLILSLLTLSAQQPSRSGHPAPLESRDQLRQFPCGGELLFEEKFRGNALPAGWVQVDRDNQDLDARIDTLFQKGWQSIADFKFPNNRAVASSSWYANDTVPADDWLISPAIPIQDNTCLSWYAYSQDRYYPENYEVLISLDPPSGPDGILPNADTLLKVTREGFFINFRSISLTDFENGKYRNQQAYIAFRHTSLNKFMLVLDDVRVAEVEEQDLGVFAVQDFEIDPGDSVFFQASLRNYSLDTLRIDNGLDVGYSVNGATPVRASIFDTTSLVIAPNDTVQFSFPVPWAADSTADIYYICLFSEWDQDPEVANDTFCIRVGVGLDITSVGESLESPLRIYPNPAKQAVFIQWKGAVNASVTVYDLQGKIVLASQPLKSEKELLDISGLLPGLYLIQVEDEQGRRWNQKMIKE